MSTTHRLRPRAATLLVTGSALLGLAAGTAAHADEILVAQTNMISGTVSTVDSFTAPGNGTVTIQLANIPWPAALSSLSFFASNATQVLASGTVPPPNGPVSGTTLESFQVTPGTYFAHITGTAAPAAPGSYDLGLYSMQVSFAPAVPLPAAGFLLGGGLLVLAGLGRRFGFLRPAGSLPAAA
jgi:hypothetical protein